MDKIVNSGNKVDFHIHSFASKHKESDDKVDSSTIDNIDVLIKMLNDRCINMCSISDHDNFDYDLYKGLKLEESKGSIKKVFPAVEFSVSFVEKILHIITIFDDNDDSKIKKIQNEIFDIVNNKPRYDKNNLSFSESKFLEILRKININVVMIVHQKGSLSSKNTTKHDIKDLGDDIFNKLIFLDYFESMEFSNKRNEIFNKFYFEKNKDKFGDSTLRFITGSDCHKWSEYPEENDKFSFTYLKCLPTFRGLAMAITNIKRINYVNNFFSVSDKYLDAIHIQINMKDYDIKLSKGINVIIGDNSIGKSLLIHKLTDYNFLNDNKLKQGYDTYLRDNKINLLTKVSSENISGFNSQGSIRKMFENKDFDNRTIINDYFPVEPSIDKYLKLYKDEINRYILTLKNKEELKKAKDKLNNFTIQYVENNAMSLNLSNISQVVINNFNTQINEINKIVNKLENINSTYKEILDSGLLDETDKFYIDEVIKKNVLLIDKYKLQIKNKKNEVLKINIINRILSLKTAYFNKTKTDETKKIEAYINGIKSFCYNIVDYYIKAKKRTKFIPNIINKKLPIETRINGKYRFVIKSNIEEVSNDNLISIIKGVIGNSFNDINDIDSNTIPQKFCDKTRKNLTYYDKLENLKKELNDKIDDSFKLIKLINNADNKDVTSELSAGFNSKIYFDLISYNDDHRTYFIDQPEDDVSQTSIKNSLLDDFSNMGKNKQIIMITHNPQFIVNLDVDNVIYICKNENNDIEIKSGALEYYDDDYDILKIVADNIEGGIESINERWKRYDKNIHNV